MITVCRLFSYSPQSLIILHSFYLEWRRLTSTDMIRIWIGTVDISYRERCFYLWVKWEYFKFHRFIQNLCFYYKYIPLSLALLLNYLIIFKSPHYAKGYRRALAFYHVQYTTVTSIINIIIQISDFLFDIHHHIFYVPYPLLNHPIYLCYGLLCQMGGTGHMAFVRFAKYRVEN